MEHNTRIIVQSTEIVRTYYEKAETTVLFHTCGIKAHVYLNDLANKYEKLFLWCEENARAVHKGPLHAQNLFFGCGLWAQNAVNDEY